MPRVIFVPKTSSIRSAVTDYGCDRQTDGQNCRIAYAAVACNALRGNDSSRMISCSLVMNSS